MKKQINIIKIKQVFCKENISDIHGYIHHAFYNSNLPSKTKPGDRIGITVGSRGISNLYSIIKQIITELKNIRTKPFILAAMGSHGGATSQGQRGILASYNITEEEMGVPILSAMDTVKIGTINNDIPVYFSKEALKADGIIALNRIKLHTDFKSDILESGMSKILVIGLGKKDGAESIHSLGVYGLKNIIPRVVELIIKKAPIIQGIGILENGYNQTMEIKFCQTEDIIKTDSRLLKKCKEIIPSLPCKKIDFAIVQEMGKNISGTGMDTNVIGRLDINGEEKIAKPHINKLVVFDITEQSHGNALGIGLADVVTRKLVNKINYQATYANVVTSTFLNRAKIPIIAETEKEAVDIALKTCWQPDVTQLRLIIIKNTANLEYMYVSREIWNEVRCNSNINVNKCGDWEVLSFDQYGNVLNIIN